MVELPKYLNATSEEVVDKYIKLNAPDVIRKRQKRTLKFGRHVDDLVDNIIKDTNIEAKSPEERMKLAQDVIQTMAKEWYDSLGIKQEKMSDEMIEAYIKEIDPNMSYSSLIKHIADKEYDFDTNKEGTYLNAFKRHLMKAKDDEGLEVQKLQRTLQTEHKHYDHLRTTISDLLPDTKKLSNAASAMDILSEYQQHIDRKIQEGPKSKTYYEAPKEYKKAA
jgi:hypothetical protein